MPVMTEKKPSRRRSARTGASLSIWLSGPLMAALESFIHQSRPHPTKTSVIEAALEDFLAARGLWPPPEKK